jgi:zinc-finger-containing domain
MTKCHCGNNAVYHSSNAVIYNGTAYGDRGVWVCSAFPQCDSYVGTHPSGLPLGRLKNAKSRELAKKAHGLFDPKWRGKGNYMEQDEQLLLAISIMEKINLNKKTPDYVPSTGGSDAEKTR